MENELIYHLLDWVRSHYFGKYRGTVSDNSDSTSRGRIKVTVPAVLGTLEVWAMPCVPYAGPSVGFYSLPPTGAGVWIEFEAGDPSYPVWSGCFWADDELPDSSDASIKIWQTDSLKVRMDDDGDEMLLENSSDSSIKLSSEVTIDSNGSTHTVGSDGVESENQDASHKVSVDGIVSELGSGKVEVTASSVILNDGAMEVM
jgi:uncharacterized protein involved in type VI secretion and phage assembly